MNEADRRGLASAGASQSQLDLHGLRNDLIKSAFSYISQSVCICSRKRKEGSL